MIPMETQMDFATLLVKDILDERDDFVTFLEKSYLFLRMKGETQLAERVREALINIGYRRRFEYLASVKKDMENRSYYFGPDKEMTNDVFNFDEETERYMMKIRIEVIEKVAELLATTTTLDIN